MDIQEDLQLEEMYQEMKRYLVNIDELLYEIYDKTPAEMVSSIGPTRKAGTVCCGKLVDLSRAPMARTQTGEEFLICNNENCRKLVEMATPEQIKEISTMKIHLSEIAAEVL